VVGKLLDRARPPRDALSEASASQRIQAAAQLVRGLDRRREDR
jgi:hypothetical protein